MPATKVQLIGGSFQDSEGNLLALGYLKMKLNQDEAITGVGQICSGVEITINLNASGAVITSPLQSVWGNDQMLPVNSYYRVTGYTASGQQAWGPNNQQVNGSGGTFDVGTWTPNSVISWTPTLQQALVLKTNGTLNGSQVLQDLKNGTNITITDDTAGGITINAAGATQSGPLPSLANWHYWSAYPNTAFAQATGMALGSGGTITKINPTATEPSYTQTATGAGAGSNTAVNESTPGACTTPGIFKSFQAKVILPSTAQIRVWIGFAASIAGFSSDTPANNFIGFRYSTAAGDTKWRCVVNNSATQTATDSGISLTTSGFALGFSKNSSGDYVYTINGTTVVTILHTNANIPTSGTTLQPMVWVDNVGVGNAKGIGLAYLYWDTSV